MEHGTKSDYPDGNEPYFLDEETEYGTCHFCGSGLENWGAVSDGDGCIYDEIGCPSCQEVRGSANEIYTDYDEWGDDEYHSEEDESEASNGQV